MNVVPFEGLDEGLGHAVGLGAVIGGRADLHAHHPRKILGLSGGVSGPVVAEPLDLRGKLVHGTEAGLDRLGHQVPYHIPADAPRCGHVAHDLPIAAVHTEGHSDPLPVPAGDLEGVGTPTEVAPDHLHRAVMDPYRPARVTLQKQPVLLHDPVNPLVIHSNVPKLPVEKGRNPSVTVSSTLVHDLADHRQIVLMIGAMEPRRDRRNEAIW